MSSTVARLLRLRRLTTRLKWVLLTGQWQSHQHAVKDFHSERLSSSTWRKAVGSFPSSGLIFMLGPAPCNPQDSAQVCTVRELLSRSPTQVPWSSPPRILNKTQVEDTWPTG